MSAGSIFLILALFSLSGLGICHKVADFQRCRPSAVSVTMFATAAAVLWVYTLVEVFGLGVGLFPPFTRSAVLVAALCGACAGIAILTFQVGVRYGRISTSWLVINLSTIVPTLLSLIIYKEWNAGWKHIAEVGSSAGWQQIIRAVWAAWGRQIVGLTLVFASVVFLWRDKAVEIARGEQPVPRRPVPGTSSSVPDGHLATATREEA
jgi:hypothetical protein